MVADKGAENTPAYRNQMYGVFRNFPLEKFGFKLPGIIGRDRRVGRRGTAAGQLEPGRQASCTCRWRRRLHIPKGPSDASDRPIAVRRALADLSTGAGQYYMEFTLRQSLGAGGLRRCFAGYSDGGRRRRSWPLAHLLDDAPGAGP